MTSQYIIYSLQNLVYYIQTDRTAFMVVVILFSLLIGSFLNVVIYRLPIMLHREWKEQCCELLKTATANTEKAPTFNLVVPSSRCPNCQQPIRPWQNIPIISFLLLKGHSACCKQKISWRYPVVEALSAIAAGLVAWHFGFSWQTLFVIILTCSLISLTFIDIDHQLLPDDITLPLIWLGLLINIHGLLIPLQDAVIGAMAGYLSLWLFTGCFKLVTGKVGMGHGDFKLMAVFGAWLGWQQIPLIIFGSSTLGAIIGITIILIKHRDANLPIPFGPYIAVMGWWTLLWGHELTTWYLHFAIR